MESIEKYETKAVEIYERHEVLGADVLDRSDMIMPRVRVRQPVSKFGTPQDAGKFHNNLTEVFAENIEAVILRVSKGRVMWPEAFDGTNEPVCASDDALIPREGNRLSNKLPGPCPSCPMVQWGDDHEPPRCSLVYTYLCTDRSSDDMPFLLSAMRTSAKSAKKLNTLIKMFGIKRSITIKSTLVNGDQGQWYELIFQVAATLAPEEIQRYAGMAASLAGVTMTVDTENTAATSDLDDNDFAESTGDFGGAEPLGF